MWEHGQKLAYWRIEYRLSEWGEGRQNLKNTEHIRVSPALGPATASHLACLLDW
jgi:hypothetical protein